MSFSVSVPPLECSVRPEALYDGDPMGGQTDGCLHMAVSVPGSCLHFNVVLNNGAMWDEVPIYMVIMKHWGWGNPPGPHLDPAGQLGPESLQACNCPSAAMVVEYRDILMGQCIEYLDKERAWIPCGYLMTMNWSFDRYGTNLGRMMRTGPDPLHLLVRPDGLLAAQPNYRCRVTGPVLSPEPWPKDGPGYRSRITHSFQDSCEFGDGAAGAMEACGSDCETLDEGGNSSEFELEAMEVVRLWLDEHDPGGRACVTEWRARLRLGIAFDTSFTGPELFGPGWLSGSDVTAETRQRHRSSVDELNTKILNLHRKHNAQVDPS